MSTAIHACQLCGQAFHRPSALKVHMNTHTGAKPFVCPWKGCEKTFSVNSNMRRHLRTHTDEEFPDEDAEDDAAHDVPRRPARQYSADPYPREQEHRFQRERYPEPEYHQHHRPMESYGHQYPPQPPIYGAYPIDDPSTRHASISRSSSATSASSVDDGYWFPHQQHHFPIPQPSHVPHLPPPPPPYPFPAARPHGYPRPPPLIPYSQALPPPPPPPLPVQDEWAWCHAINVSPERDRRPREIAPSQKPLPPPFPRQRPPPIQQEDPFSTSLPITGRTVYAVPRLLQTSSAPISRQGVSDILNHMGDDSEDEAEERAQKEHGEDDYEYEKRVMRMAGEMRTTRASKRASASASVSGKRRRLS